MLKLVNAHYHWDNWALVGAKGPGSLQEKIRVQSEAGVEVVMDNRSGPGEA